MNSHLDSLSEEYKPGAILVEVRGGNVVEVYRMEPDGNFYPIVATNWGVLDWDNEDEV